jgi:hypothetical protein
VDRLPRQAGARGLLDRSAEIVVGDLRDRRPEIRRKRYGRGDSADPPPFGWTLDDVQRADAKAQTIDREASLFEPKEELGREELELVGPHARGDSDDERTPLDGDRPRARGDARSDGGAPLAQRKRRSPATEAILAGPLDEIFDGLGRVERGAPAAPVSLAGRPRHDRPC